MENLAIARIFSEIADLLEIKSENPFKIRAYRNASETIAHATEKLAYLTEEQLRAIPGIGKELAVQNPRDCRNRRSPLSPGFARTVSADDPRPAAPSGRRTQNRGVALYRARHQDDRGARDRVRRRPCARAERSGTEEGAAHPSGVRRAETAHGPPPAARCRRGGGLLLEYLRAECPTVVFDNVGSIRRGADTSGDIDILATGNDPHVMTTFTMYKLVERILGQGETKSSVRLWGGIQADLRLVPAESRGAAMQYFTGSKSHNIALRDRAIARGFKLNEYGLFRVDDGSLVAGRTEAEIYDALGLAEIPPELREGRGELEAAEQRALPDLVRLEDIRGDIHCTRPKPTAVKTSRRWRSRRGRGAAVPGDYRSQQGAGDGERTRRAPRARACADVSAKSGIASKASRCSPASSAISALTDPWISPTTASRSSTWSWRRFTRRSIRTKRR